LPLFSLDRQAFLAFLTTFVKSASSKDQSTFIVTRDQFHMNSDQFEKSDDQTKTNWSWALFDFNTIRFV